MWNRLCWAFLWLTSFSLFVLYLVLQTQYLVSNPTSTLITRQFNATVQFPSVSICISSLSPDSVKSFAASNPGETPREQLTSLFNSSGILCYYGRPVRQLWNADTFLRVAGLSY